MGVGMVWGISAGILAIASGGFLADGLSRSVRRNRAVLTMLSDGWVSRVRIFLMSGIKPFLGISKHLLKIAVVGDIAAQASMLLEEKGFKSSKPALVSILFVIMIAVFITATVLTGSMVFGVASSCITVISIGGYVKNRNDKATENMREDVPEVIRCMQSCFKSGFSLLQTLRYTSNEISGSLGRMFAKAADRLDVGDTTKEALSVLRQHSDVPELAFVAVALDVQHQTGGSIAPVLDSARESVEGELELVRTLRVQTAQAKLSATIVTIMPFVLIALFSLMSPDFLSPFFSSVQGCLLLALALVMQIAGVLSVRRMLKIDIM